MKSNAFKEFVYIILVNASQTASLEEAHVTKTLLSNLIGFYKHMIRDNENALLIEEIQALNHYFEIQKTRYGERFDTHISDTTEGDIFVEHFAIISFVDEILNNILSRYECFFQFNISFFTKGDTILTEISVDLKGKKELCGKSFTKRGGRLCINS